MKIFDISPNRKTLVLGTALWGWGISRHIAYEILEKFLRNGGTIIDTATNYPINKCGKDFGLAIRWIADWVSVNKGSNLSLIVKIGSTDNMGGSSIDLRPESIFRSANTLRNQLGETLSCVSIHWDERSDEEKQRHSIDQTVKAMVELEKSGLEIGISGIRRPDLYYKAAPTLCDKWVIQIKENVSTRLARQSYQEFFPRARYLAYGINLGGLKKETPKKSSSLSLRKIDIPDSLVEKLSFFLNSDHGFEPKPISLNDLALASSYVNPALSGVIIGPRNVEQMVNTIEYWQQLRQRANRIDDHKLLDELVK